MKGILALKGLMIENRVFLKYYYYYYYFKLWGGKQIKGQKNPRKWKYFEFPTLA